MLYGVGTTRGGLLLHDAADDDSETVLAAISTCVAVIIGSELEVEVEIDVVQKRRKRRVRRTVCILVIMISFCKLL